MEKAWLDERLQDLASRDITHKKAMTLQARILRHYNEWLRFVDDPRVLPTNHLAERALRPLVILRQITFGHRSQDGGNRLAAIMIIAETARRHGRQVSEMFYEVFTRPPTRVMRRLYSSV